MPYISYAGPHTTRAAFIEEAQSAGELFIHQPYAQYSEPNHDSWRRLYARMPPRWDRFANAAFRNGIASLSLNANAIPRLEDVNRFCVH
ncbi:MAG: hypothetical protein M3Y57_19305 [Acidobacteriota bacterium]|nr:hypothetical protein [Acidobacteriota bacterium]